MVVAWQVHRLCSNALRRPLVRTLSSLQRAVSELDEEACRRVGTGKRIRTDANPGIRLESKFVSEESAAELEREVRELEPEWGFTTEGHGLEVVTVDGAKQVSEGSKEEMKQFGEFKSRRITGRPERQEKPAPWGYGDDFDEGALPAAMTKLVASIRGLNASGYALGRVCDVTINYRDNHFFRLDPHVDPQGDGPTVFILGLLSDAVLTFVPPGVKPRKDPVEIGLRSWTDQDIDVLLQKRSLCSFSGPARDSWGHAIRGGMEVTEADGRRSVVDFWGRSDYLLRRNPERISIVVAFGSAS